VNPPTPALERPEPIGIGPRSRLGWLWGMLAPFVGLVLVLLFFYLLRPDAFLTSINLKNVAVQTVITGTCALGMTFVIISGGIDLSVGSVIALSGVTAAVALKQGWGSPTAVAVGIATGALCGLINGLVITKLRIVPFIATLGMLLIARGAAKGLAHQKPVRPSELGGLADFMQPFPEPSWLLVAPGVWVLLGLALLAAALLRFHVLGKYTFAIGSNEATARLCGVRVHAVKICIYTLAGLLTGVAGVMQLARLTEGDPTVAIGLELPVIAAVVIGGGSLMGGEGGIVGTMIGAFMMTFLANGCTLAGWPNWLQEIIIGGIIIVAVGLDQWRHRRTP